MLQGGDRIQGVAKFLLRHGLVLIVGWIGGYEVYCFETAGIQPLLESSPFIS
jgi:uncharacterized membrane protein YkgB